jgi:hypothetical protein
MGFGWCCLALALLLFFLSFNAGPTASQISLATNPYAGSYAASDLANAYARVFLMQVAGGGFFSLFLILWSVGYIVRAISFLPGKDDS